MRGSTAGELHALFNRHSKTPVPQGLTYLIDDVARRHGQLRVGMAASFVRCEDPALLAQAVAAPATETVEMRLLAPTVAVSQAPIAEVLAALRTRGSRRQPRTPRARSWICAPAAPAFRRRAAVAGTGPTRPERSDARGDRRGAAQGRRSVVGRCDWIPRSPSRELQQAAHHQESVVIGYVDPAGVATQRVVAPINVRGGQLTAYDPASGRVREFAIHRVTSVVSADTG